MKPAQFEDRELLGVICDVSEIKSMKVAINSSVKTGLAVGVLTTLGGLLLGPRGLAVGGILGGLGASVMMDGSFKSVPDIILHEATPEQQRILLDSIRDLLTAENILNMAMLMSALSSGDATLLYTIKDLVIKFLRSLDYQI